MTPRTVVLTFDNLGEAAELEQGAWPAGRPRGEHPSVVTALPRLLDLLDELGLRGTFFVEAVNTIDYPDAVRSIAGRGHEVGFHAWRHEPWGELGADRERELVERGVAAFGELGVAVRGFRPPGGALTARRGDELRRSGFDWCSPLGRRAGIDERGMAQVPFRWELVDATYLYAPFRELRRGLGLPAEPLAVERFEERFWHEIDTEPDPTAATIVLHPFLSADPPVGEAHARILRRLRRLADDGIARIVTGAELADELRAAGRPPAAVLG
ncbi:MAG TPA: polysaccharide deacetylase family protein [Solirubrobacteraceae bacterium]|nr:polysaccharide deacetylase family protein [Solirubrobacteraceae bacterium]